jgi:hypothetical protein
MAELRYWMSTMHVATLIGRDRTASAGEVLKSVETALGVRLSEPAAVQTETGC